MNRRWIEKDTHMSRFARKQNIIPRQEARSAIPTIVMRNVACRRVWTVLLYQMRLVAPMMTAPALMPMPPSSP